MMTRPEYEAALSKLHAIASASPDVYRVYPGPAHCDLHADYLSWSGTRASATEVLGLMFALSLTVDGHMSTYVHGEDVELVLQISRPHDEICVRGEVSP